MIKRVKIPLKSKFRNSLEKIKKDPMDKVKGKRHFSVGAVIRKNKNILIMNRNLYPPGYAGIAGHINKNETPEQALYREVKEETNYDITNKKLLFHEIIHGNECRTGFIIHEWFLYECKVKGKLKMLRREEKSISYMNVKQINKLYKRKKLEPVWEYWFKKLKVIK